ncbi:hypothetical protein Nepgr_003435 [Nepenthes gracilis]|uniref:Protein DETOXIFICATION n=1 Tax=Nepenthes gracilis TaxID=150966 RepID=A0AAD3RZH9_NEPGR|nr:hypothetical protein Nepgr_003435 [Nepenthes gracilis]
MTMLDASGMVDWEEEKVDTGQVYTVGPEYVHAEARKSPVVDGVVMSNPDGKEVRYLILLTPTEKQMAREVCMALQQMVCGFDLLRCGGRSYVCDVNGWSFVKNSHKYYDDAACVLRKQMSAAAFAKGLLDLEGQLTPILVSLVSKDSSMLDGLENASTEIETAKARLNESITSGAQTIHGNGSFEYPWMVDGVGLLPHGSELLPKLAELTKKITEQVRLLAKDEDENLAETSSGNVVPPYDITQIPDVYDSCKDDLLYNAHLNLEGVDELLKAVQVGMSSALETLCGQAYGAQQYQTLGTQTYTAILCLILVSIPISALWIYMGEILTFIGQDPVISHEAGKFITCLLPALYAYAALQPLVRYFQSQSLIISMLLCSCIILSLHVPLCWVLVFKSGLKNLGAAVPMDISLWLNVIFLALCMKFSTACAKTRSRLSMKVFQGIGEFFQFAVPSAVMICLEWWSFELLILLSGLLPNPELETSVLSICLTTISTVYAIPYGVGAAASTRVSNELGARNPEGARTASYAAVLIEVIETTIVSTTLFAAQRVFSYSFGNEKEVGSYLTLETMEKMVLPFAMPAEDFPPPSLPQGFSGYFSRSAAVLERLVNLWPFHKHADDFLEELHIDNSSTTSSPEILAEFLVVSGIHECGLVQKSGGASNVA